LLYAPVEEGLMRSASIVLFAVAALVGCSGQSTRAISGQLRVDTSAMNRPVVIAQSSDHRTFVADVSASGRFTLQLPAGASYRMSLAATTRSGVYTTSARINWPLASGNARWATLGGGGALDLGAVFERGTRPTSGLGTSCDSCGGSGGDDGDDHGDGDHGSCHEEDDSCSSHGGDVDDDCDHQVSSGDHCDKDDDAGEHDHDADEDMCHADGGTGGGAGGGGDTGTGPIN